MNIYQIIDEFKDIENLLIESEGEVTDELNERLNINRDEYEYKMEAFAKIRANLLGDVEGLTAEIIRLDKLRDAKQKSVERLEAMMQYALTHLGTQDKKGVFRLETPLFKFSTRRSEKVVIQNEDMIADTYKRVIPAKFEVDKKAIKEALSKNEPVTGAELITNYNLQIK